ncbi:DUF2169 family type VI secretion system accessory protein [Chondromyces crocatus]|uniref:DUF2169 domain-containing protein n=1 Tax=Chondromyces crocatus TaxID=52 RepID=A0A0K1EBP0_CHOCO|nr:DUF2169 domain-containing protein [Chondromyces crocatus]AKT37998.1 uncharacterized protein CMC5_021390 [Chondromyces crocatus]
MELTNLTRYPAGLARMLYGEDRIAASLLVRVTYDLRNERLVPSEEQPWIVSSAPWPGPQGVMDGDHIFYKEGADVFLFGRAIPPGSKPATSMAVVLTIGASFHRTVRVFGPRVWHRRLGELVPTSPRPFTSLPLTLQYAYGGKDTWDELDIPYQENPEGMGFHVEEANAIDRPLPCVEEPDQLVTRWDDHPLPAGLVPYPPESPLRAKHGLVRTPEGKPKVTPRFFNAAFPPMIAQGIAAGEAVSVTGVSERGPLNFTLPTHAFAARLRFGSEAHEMPLAIDQVGIEVDARRVFIAYRYPFRYVIQPLQARRCELVELSTPR